QAARHWLPVPWRSPPTGGAGPAWRRLLMPQPIRYGSSSPPTSQKGLQSSGDGWKSYPPASAGYHHQGLNVSGSGRRAHEALPAIHRLFSLFKRLVEGTYQGGISHEHLQGYLDEFVFRFNRRHSHNRGLLFMRLLQRAIGSEPVTYRDLVRIQRPKSTYS